VGVNRFVRIVDPLLGWRPGVLATGSIEESETKKNNEKENNVQQHFP
jgi:hypothetical protein